MRRRLIYGYTDYKTAYIWADMRHFFFWSIDIYNNKVPLGRYTYTTRLPLTVTTKNNGSEIFFPLQKM